jgi:hypothetical protein
MMAMDPFSIQVDPHLVEYLAYRLEDKIHESFGFVLPLYHLQDLTLVPAFQELQECPFQ